MNARLYFLLYPARATLGYGGVSEVLASVDVSPGEDGSGIGVKVHSWLVTRRYLVRS